MKNEKINQNCWEESKKLRVELSEIIQLMEGEVFAGEHWNLSTQKLISARLMLGNVLSLTDTVKSPYAIALWQRKTKDSEEIAPPTHISPTPLLLPEKVNTYIKKIDYVRERLEKIIKEMLEVRNLYYRKSVNDDTDRSYLFDLYHGQALIDIQFGKNHLGLELGRIRDESTAS